MLIRPSTNLLFFACLVFLLIDPSLAASQTDDDLLFPAYYGITGLFDMPTARIMPDWNIRMHYSWADPLQTFGIAATPLPFLEVNGRFTRFRGVPGLSESYGSATDKALDVKIRLHDEDDFWPAIALGANDIHGTALFTSRYLALSKMYGPLDVSLGLGQGVLAGEITQGAGSSGSASRDAAFRFLTSGATKTRVFGGAELRMTQNLSLVGEYSSLDYEEIRRGKGGITRPADSQINFGIKYRLKKVDMTASYLRGDVFAWSLSTRFPLAPEGMLPWKPQPFWTPDEALKKRAREATNEELARILSQEVAAEKFNDVRASVGDAAVWVEIENRTYLSNDKAIGRALRAICALVPARIEWIYISLKSSDIILLTVKIGRQDFEAYIDGRIDTDTLLEFISLDNEGNELRDVFRKNEPGATPLTKPAGPKRFLYGVDPLWRTFLNDPSGFFKQSFSFLWYGSYFPWAGGVFTGGFLTPLYNDISTSNENEEKEPVRTDAVRYLAKKDVRLEVLAYDQVINLPNKWLARGEVGLFESAYGGLGLELFRFFNEGRLGIGLEAEWVKKRDLDEDFKFADDSPVFRPAYLNIYYKLFPSIGVDVGLKLGRFLAGDRGGRLDVSRTFKHFTMGAWYTVTDTDDFTASYNRGYNDKGVYLVVPFSVFKEFDSPIKLFYALSPWTRDPGQTVNQVNSLYPMANSVNIDTMKRQLEDLKQ